MQDVLQFSDIAVKRVASQLLQHRRGQHGDGAKTRFMANPCQQGFTEFRQVFPAFTQGGHTNHDDIEAVIQVLAKTSGLDFGPKLLVCGAHNAHIHRIFL
ncbi:hypothetical protein D9M73_27030 [compost metagenome]